MRTLTVAFALALLVTACATRRETRSNRAMRVEAAAHHTRAALMQAFTEKQIPLSETSESQRLLRPGSDARVVTIVSDTIRLNSATDDLAKCRTTLGTSVAPDAAVYRVSFVGDSSATSLMTNVIFTRRDPGTGERQSCKSLGVWERQLDSYVRLHAERRR